LVWKGGDLNRFSLVFLTARFFYAQNGALNMGNFGLWLRPFFYLAFRKTSSFIGMHLEECQVKQGMGKVPLSENIQVMPLSSLAGSKTRLFD
jgi:hypothetical protein